MNIKKLVFVLLTIALISSCSQAQSQDDFYGTWIWEAGGAKMEYNISGATFTSVFTPVLTILTPVTKTTFEIFSWEKITNENEDTKADYPAGYLVGLRNGLVGNTTARLFMHRDKNSLINAYQHNDGLQQEVYIKPASQSDFYGKWRWLDDKGEISESELTFTRETSSLARTYNPNPLIENISSWEIIINNDINTKNDYPSGYLIRIKYGENENDYYGNRYYLHKDKNSILLDTTGSRILNNDELFIYTRMR